MLLFVEVLNIIFLWRLAVQDMKTHTAPKIATAMYVLLSLVVTNPQHLMEGALLCVLMFAVTPVIRMGNADKKILFGLTLQLGWHFGVMLFAFSLLIVILKKAQGDEFAAIPLIPVILIGYIIRLLYILVMQQIGV